MRKLLCIFLFFTCSVHGADLDPKILIEKAMEHWRGVTSYSEMTMVIHRPDWQRSMTLQAWTEGDEHSLVRVVKPKKDAGNGTLVKDNDVWSFSPKVNRIIKIPSSMMNQSWMGSDFSNRDISKSTEIIDQYDHKLLETREEGEFTVYVVESIPKEDAAVVWGREVVTVRSDFVMLRHEFWDQDGELAKTMVTTEIAVMDGKTVAKTMRIAKLDQPDEWTETRMETVDFNIDLPGNTFTLSNLRNPRP